MKSYIKRIRHHLELRVPKHSQTQRSFKLTFDPGDFVCDLAQIDFRVFDRDLDGSVGIRLAGEAEFDHGQAWRGGGSDGRKNCGDPE